jgi:hypothetical protein
VRTNGVERGPDVRAGEVVADIEERAVEFLGRGIGEAIAEVEGCGMEAFAEALLGCGGAFCAC